MGQSYRADDQKLAHWTEHFGLFMNCGKEVKEL